MDSKEQIFVDRQEAGLLLAYQLKQHLEKQQVNPSEQVILALPRGGVPVAYEIAKVLKASLDILIVRKLGVPGYEEVAFGALACENVTVFNDELLKDLRLSSQSIQAVIDSETKELARRNLLYRQGRPLPHLLGKSVILVDDGIATGATMRVAIKVLRQLSPACLMVAIPVVAHDALEQLRPLVDEVICLKAPHDFDAVATWYEHFPQTSDAEVLDLMTRAIV